MNRKTDWTLLIKHRRYEETTSMIIPARQTAIRCAPLAKRTLLRSVATQVQNNGSRNTNNNPSSNGQPFVWLRAAMVMGTAGTAVTLMDARKKKKKPHYEQPASLVPSDTPTSIPKVSTVNQTPARPELPVYTQEEVSEHCDEDSLWYAFRGAVYDLTSFYQGHPGGAPVSITFFKSGCQPFIIFAGLAYIKPCY
jgi:hypothetical protein